MTTKKVIDQRTCAKHSETQTVYIIPEAIPIKRVKIIKERRVVTNIARTISPGFTSYAAQRASEKAPHGPSDTNNGPRNSFG